MLADHVSSRLQKDKEDLEEVATELELADEDELVPYVFLRNFLDRFTFV